MPLNVVFESMKEAVKKNFFGEIPETSSPYMALTSPLYHE